MNSKPDLSEDYQKFCRPKVATILKLLKIDWTFDRAEDNYLYDDQGRKVLDLLGGYGSTLLGHSHPKLVEVVKEFFKQKKPIHAQASIRKEATKLAQNIDQILKKEMMNDQDWITHLSSTGTEAVEAAIKHQLMHFKSRQKYAKFINQAFETSGVIFAVKNSFHGKSAGSVSVTWNQNFKSMYSQSACRVEFLDPENVFESKKKLIASTSNFNQCVGIIFEPIQCEGGIKELPQDFCNLLNEFQKQGICLIADEIQSGTFRTGDFLASKKLGLNPDIILLGKSIGGGIVKLACTCIKRELYQDDFGYLHTSTFAEDDFSSTIALESLNILQTMSPQISNRAKEFAGWIDSERASLEKYQPFLKEIRCYGFLVGIEFNFEHAPSTIPLFFKLSYEAGFATYLLMSALLNNHHIRVGVTLSQPNTLRVEPSLFITKDQITLFFTALKNQLDLICAGKILELTKYLWRDNLSINDLSNVSARFDFVEKEQHKNYRTVAFTTHVINERHLLLIDSMFKKLSAPERIRFLNKFSEVAGPFCYHDQIIQGQNGTAVRLCSVGTFKPTSYFENSLKFNDGKACEVVEEMVEFANELGADLVGLGQYTSIVTKAGTKLKHQSMGFTSGNALTSVLVIKALEKLLDDKSLQMEKCTVGVVGALGNIGLAISQVLFDKGCNLTLIVRDENQIEELKKHFPKSIKLKFSSNLDELTQCSAIIAATNTVKSIIFPKHLAPNAIVIDASVPTIVDESVILERKDVISCHGGLAKLPFNQKITSDFMPLPAGEMYACLAELLVLALTNFQGSFSIGKITKEQIYDIEQRANIAGIKLGQLLPLYFKQ